MLIRTVRENNPIAILLIILIGGLLWLPGLLEPSAPAALVYTPLYAPVDFFLRSHPLISVICGFILSLTEAFLLNYIIYEHHLLTKKSWLPALIFAILSACTPGLLWLHPQAIAGLFLLGTLHLLLGTYRSDKAFGAVFNAGFLLGLASLFYVPSIVFLVFAITVIILLRPFIWREWIIFFFGVCVPLIYSFVYFFWNDRLQEVTRNVVTDPVVHRDFFLKLAPAYYALTFVVLFLVTISMGRFIAGAGTSTLKTKKGVSVMVWFLVFAIISILPAQNYAVAGFLFSLFPLSLFISKYFLTARRGWIAEVIFVLLLASIFLSYFLSGTFARA
jgi:hypothetical protein